MAYGLAPSTPYLPAPFSFGSPVSSEDVFTKNISLENFKRLVSRTDYVLLAYPDKNFWNHYGKIFVTIQQTFSLS